MRIFETADAAAPGELPETSAARAILTALNHILDEGGETTVTSQQVVNELLPGHASLRNWFLYLIDEANSQDQETVTSKAIQEALGFEEEHFERGCKIALSIVA